jgi:hypothetical protein
LARIYLSTDTQITTNDYRCSFDDTTAQFSATSLNANGSLMQNVLCCPGDPSLPGTVTRGTTYHWGAIVDPTNFYAESNENNNAVLGGTFTLQ